MIVPLSVEALSINFPLKSVSVPFVVPLITTLAPGNPSFVSSTMVPEIFVWPITVAAIKNRAANNKFLKFFIIEY